MDADDIALPQRFQDQIDFLECHPEVGLLGGAVELITDSGRSLGTDRPPIQDSEIKLKMPRSNPIWHPSVVMRKAVVLAAGGYRSLLMDADDYDLFLRVGERSQLANLNKVVLKYRIHVNQVSIQSMERQILCFLAAGAAASQRRYGKPDPLHGLESITPQLLGSLGVSPEQAQQRHLDFYGWWIQVLKNVAVEDAPLAFRIIRLLVKGSGSDLVKRSVSADAWLAAAGIYYRQRRFAKAVVSAGRAFLLKPSLGKTLIRAAGRKGHVRSSDSKKSTG
jgi:hypothetical protein